ncbi:MAG: 5'-nucleotidase C-terminal domain-containing protein, partial [Armatimonadota bacterium]
MLCRLVLAVLIAVASAASAAPEAAGTEPVSTESVSPLGNKDVGKTETAIGDLAADAVRSFLNVNIAFIAASELKLKDPPFPAGKITTRDIEPL